MKNKYFQRMIFLSLLAIVPDVVCAQITERPRPKEWEALVPGARFMDRFLPMPEGKLSRDVWGGENVLPRYVDNGIEDNVRSYWGGNILKGDDQQFHLFVCGWPENSPKGHFEWPYSIVYHATCDNPIGPFVVKGTVGAGHNPEAFRTQDGKYVIYVIDGYYKADSMDGPWSRHQFDFDRRDRPIIEGLSNLTFAQREDGSYLMVCRGGGIWISRTGLSTYNQISDKRVYPPVKGEFEDPVVWRDHVQYHLIVNDWLGRVAFYQRSKDGVHWVTDPGEAYALGVSFHADGKQEDWFKFERPKVFQDKHGRAIQMNLAVVDTLKAEDKASDRHSSKNIGIPLNPGLLITMLNRKPMTEKTKEIRIKVAAEAGFNPVRDMDIASLRFGVSSVVNFGKGCQVIQTEQQGDDLILTFDARGHGITPDEFAPKLIGKTQSGKMLYGYTRVPWVDYNEPILSARKPVLTSDAKGTNLKITVENFGQIASRKATLQVTYKHLGTSVKVGTVKVPALQPYEGKEVSFVSPVALEKEKAYDFDFTYTYR